MSDEKCHCGCTAADRAATGQCNIPGCPYPEIALKIGDRVPMPPAPKLVVRPTFVDKLSHPRGAFNRGRKQTI